MTPFSNNYNNPKATINLYEHKKERDLIDLEDEPLNNKQQTSDKSTMEVHIKFEDLIGDQQVSFTRNEPEKKPAKPVDVMQYMEVMDYIDKCNRDHALLMQQVAETRLRCRKIFYEYM